MNVSETGQTLRSQVLRAGHGLDYKPSQLPSELYYQVADQVCRSLMIADDMAKKEAMHNKMRANTKPKPWALKDPYLRIFMPFFSEIVNYKFLHVTRDPRCIHETHMHEQFYETFNFMEQYAD